MKKKEYKKPDMEIIKIDNSDIVCASVTSMFSVDEDIEPGAISDWGDNLNW